MRASIVHYCCLIPIPDGIYAVTSLVFWLQLMQDRRINAFKEGLLCIYNSLNISRSLSR